MHIVVGSYIVKVPLQNSESRCSTPVGVGRLSNVTTIKHEREKGAPRGFVGSGQHTLVLEGKAFDPNWRERAAISRGFSLASRDRRSTQFLALKRLPDLSPL